ncbi:hypothetical protein [Pedobacter sp. HDW13]|uniref:hypothetical protein n=1 Tax=Pedobacter sp. HDW13 TaxID=2714940 RepID=UPI001980E507|nr:hypothetical protein [Pedobacter sp. HDW13]
MKSYILFFLLVITTGGLSAQSVDADSLKTKPKKENFADDWAALTKYEKENALLPPESGRKKELCF